MKLFGRAVWVVGGIIFTLIVAAMALAMIQAIVSQPPGPQDGCMQCTGDTP
jgi:hypothetical protein